MKVTHTIEPWEVWFAERRLLAARAALALAEAEANALNPAIVRTVNRLTGVPATTLASTSQPSGGKKRKINGLLAELYGDLDREGVAKGSPALGIMAAARIIVAGMERYEEVGFGRNESAGVPPSMRPARSYHQLLQLHVRRADTGQRTPSERSVRRKLNDLRADGKIRQ